MLRYSINEVWFLAAAIIVFSFTLTQLIELFFQMFVFLVLLVFVSLFVFQERERERERERYCSLLGALSFVTQDRW